MVIRFFDPRPPVRPPAGSYALSAPERHNVRIGLLANGFPDSTTFLDALALELSHSHPGATFVPVAKPSPPTPLTVEQVLVLTRSCDAVVAAYGH